MPPTNDQPSPDAAALRRQLIALKAATLQAQAARMGLKLPGEDISSAALAKINADVAALPDGALPEQVAHWAELSRRAAKGPSA